jgi:hypothetical protein
LRAGQQTAQVAHALADFARRRGDEFQSWHENSNYIIALQVQNTSALEDLYTRAEEDDLELIQFREPDLNHELTAIAFIPHASVKPFLASLKLAGTDFHAKKSCTGVRAAEIN